MIVHPAVLAVLVVLGPLALGTIAIIRGVRQRRSGRTFDPNAAPETKGDSLWLDDHERRVATFPKAVREAHHHSSNHREEILSSRECGCFHCGQGFSPSQITEWTDSTDEDTEGTTAMCPFCGIDSVIGDQSGFPVKDAFLLELNKHWF